MMYFLLFLFIVFIVAPLLAAAVKVWKIRRRMRSFMEDPFGQGGGFPFGAAGGTAPKSRQSGRRRKKIARDVGEYVAFTEVEMPAPGRGDGASPIVAETERQISDAEWEDIK
ncbi:hypothetical protein IMSAGC008_00016 [Muribaculaceae bacterium]|jgi:hypothetical protein|nr:hypothetical protein IMSAGC008_00016 [Muribaculaceae bacterium]